MKVLAINGSPNMDQGNTAEILKPFLEGMEEAGAEVEVLYTRKLNIKPCLGEFDCWLKTPGKCFQKDDMAEVLPKLAQADIWVLATPVYIDGVTGPMKNLMDRNIPLVEPFFELRDGHCRHPRREGTRPGKIALVSNCGFWEIDNFDPMIAHVKAWCKNADREFAGALLRPQGGAVRAMREMGAPVGDIIEAAKEAGRQLIREGKMSSETLDTVSRELMPLEAYVQITNQNFKQALEQNQLKQAKAAG
ncbi:MAG: flavodoxin family protein [Deltaproteobacteria bacterium]|nr:flavodoxin family protein [Deltaproteobacteria bacterium]